VRRSNARYQQEGRRRDPAQSALELMHAALEDGLRTLLQNAGATSARSARRWREEFAWLTNRDTSHPFAYERICEALGIDPDRLRRRTLAETRRAAFSDYSLAPPRGTRP
jgi:hypothetical protein